jgi:flagellar protein FlbD
MVELTRLNGSSLVVNSDLIQSAEAAPDTTLTLTNGEKIVVRESTAEVIDRTVAYRARLMAETAKHYPESMALVSATALRALYRHEDSSPQDLIKHAANHASRRRRVESQG